jgi:hypothetical protein
MEHKYIVAISIIVLIIIIAIGGYFLYKFIKNGKKSSKEDYKINYNITMNLNEIVNKDDIKETFQSGEKMMKMVISHIDKPDNDATDVCICKDKKMHIMAGGIFSMPKTIELTTAGEDVVLFSKNSKDVVLNIKLADDNDMSDVILTMRPKNTTDGIKDFTLDELNDFLNDMNIHWYTKNKVAQSVTFTNTSILETSYNPSPSEFFIKAGETDVEDYEMTQKIDMLK